MLEVKSEHFRTTFSLIRYLEPPVIKITNAILLEKLHGLYIKSFGCRHLCTHFKDEEPEGERTS